jgi:hypothetical protein
VYALTLRLLGQAWGGQSGARLQARCTADLEAALQLMRVLGSIGQHLCTLPARLDMPGVHAGLSFTMPRATEPLVELAESVWISERLEELLVGLDLVARSQPPLLRLVPQLEAIARRYAKPTEGAAGRV